LYDTPIIRFQITSWFPSLAQDPGFEVKSRDDPDHNCIALAADITNRWWWPPTPNPPTTVGRDWPDEARDEESLVAFVEAFQTIGYKRCKNGTRRRGLEKVAIYTDPGSGRPKHAAKQLPDGTWTSKLGPYWDISHTAPAGVEGTSYGKVAVYLSRGGPWYLRWLRLPAMFR
jgi:hypothetical protein